MAIFSSVFTIFSNSVELGDKLSWLFTNRLKCYQKVKRIGITETLRRIWLFSENKIKSSEPSMASTKQPIQLIIELNSSLRQKVGKWYILTKKSSNG